MRIFRDFRLHMDPEYGNCFTFNYNDSVTLKNSRAGPMYGLRARTFFFTFVFLFQRFFCSIVVSQFYFF